MSGAVSGLSAAPSGRPSLALTESGSIWPLASAASLALSALTHRCDLRDGRQLAYRFYGVPLGQARAVCIYHHGIPASLVEAEPLGAAAEAAGVALVAFDRRWGPAGKRWACERVHTAAGLESSCSVAAPDRCRLCRRNRFLPCTKPFPTLQWHGGVDIQPEDDHADCD